MRMRKKKHLDERLTATSKYVLFIEDYTFYKNKLFAESNLFDLPKLFGNANAIELEIGAGKGKFINELAVKNPDKNFLAVEKLSNVIVAASEKTAELSLDNLLYLNASAENLECFIKANSVSRIYLNHSCPYPKNSYANHRLTNIKFLEMYKRLLVKGGEIHQKTDNMHFFEYSIEQFTLAGFKLKNISLDLAKSDFEGNITTEYEEKFLQKNSPIYRLEAYL